MPERSGDPHLEPSLWRRLLRNTSWLLGARAANIPLSLVESVLLARLLGVEAYGTLGVIMATVMVLQRLFSFRMNDLVVKYLTDALETDDKSLAAVILKLSLLVEGIASILAFLAAWFSAPLLAKYFLASEPNAVLLLRVFAPMALANGVVETCSGALHVLDKFRFLASVNVLRKGLLIALLPLLYLRHWGVAAALVFYLVTNLVANAIILGRLSREVRNRLGTRWTTVPLARARDIHRELWRFAFATNLGSTLTLIIRDADILLLGFFRSPTEVGYFKLAGSLLKAPFAPGSPMAKAFYPEVARFVGRHSRDQLGAFLRRTSAISASWSIPVALVTGLVAPFMIEKLYGPDFAPASLVLRILLVGSAVGITLFWTKPTLLALGRPQWLLGVTIASACLKILLALVVVPAFGYLGLATLLTAIQLFGFFLHLIAVHQSVFSSKQALTP